MQQIVIDRIKQNKQRKLYRQKKSGVKWTPGGNLMRSISKEAFSNWDFPERLYPCPVTHRVADLIHFLKPNETIIPKIVYEIMFQYVNPEVSLAYVQPMFLSDVPIGRKYFITSALAQHEVDKINSNPLCQ